MSNFENTVKHILEMEDINEILFKRIEISPDKIIYFAFRESQKIMLGKLTSGTMDPICFILKIEDEYYYCPLNKNRFDESIVKKFAASHH